MLVSRRIVSGVLVLGSFALAPGCSAPRPPPRLDPHEHVTPRAASATEMHEETASARAADARDHAPVAIPKVVRRILVEETELVAQSRTMASDLPDPRGRARALADVDELARELGRVAEPMARSIAGDGEIDSDTLDQVVRELLLLDTRISLLHERLRTATERTTAVLVE